MLGLKLIHVSKGAQGVTQYEIFYLVFLPE